MEDYKYKAKIIIYINLMEVSVNKIWFDYINLKKKTVEGRLNKGKFKEFKKGDIIYFKNDNKKIKVIIKNIINYKTFKEYLEMEGLKRTLPGIKSIEQGEQVYYSYYTPEMEKEFGILAIEVKKI